MAHPRYPDPEKYCLHCGKRLARKYMANGRLEALIHFRRRKYCDLLCTAKDHTGKRKAILSERRMRELAHLQIGERCEDCGRQPKSLDIHHRDENPKNNEPSNLKTLCRRCHMRAHNPHWNFHS